MLLAALAPAILLGLAHTILLVGVEREWDHAGVLLADARAELQNELELPVREGEVICVSGRPDSYHGRFVMRSGIKELAFLTAGHERLEVADPVAGPGQVLLRVAAASVNPADTKIRRHGGPAASELPGPRPAAAARGKCH